MHGKLCCKTVVQTMLYNVRQTMPLMNVEQGTGRLLSIKYSPLLNLNQPTSHSGPAAPQWDNSDLIIAFIQPPKPVIANSDDLANNDDIHRAAPLKYSWVIVYHSVV